MKAQTKTLDEALREGIFDIPPYQRSYSWEQRQRDEFFQDIRYLPDGSNHFFGNIILDEKGERYNADSGISVKHFEIVDGQQRMTTVMIFLQVASELDDEVDHQLDMMNTLSLPEDRPRLLPQDQDQTFFRDVVLGDSDKNPETPSQRRLKDAYEDFKEELTNLDDEGVTVRTITQKLRESFEINIVETEGESEAAAIFESLNDRGKPLSSIEKTKSLLIYMDERSNPNNSKNKRIDQRYGDVYRDLFVLSNGHKQAQSWGEDDFQRFHWGMYDGYDSNEYYNSYDTLKTRLYDYYRDESYEEVRNLVEDYSLRLADGSGAFKEILRPWERPKIVEERLTPLLEMGRVANLMPVLMAAQLEWGDDHPSAMRKVIDLCETLAFRVYAIDRRRSNTGRYKLVNLSHDIRHSNNYDLDRTLQKLVDITSDYTWDDRFESDLRSNEFYHDIPSSYTRYLLHHYGTELDLEAPEGGSQPLDEILSNQFEVEHVLAKSLSGESVPDDIEEFDKHKHRLGNLTIANQYWNQKYGDLEFDKKKEADSSREVAYANSDIRVQRDLANIPNFNLDVIEERENEIVEFALDHWSLDYNI